MPYALVMSVLLRTVYVQSQDCVTHFQQPIEINKYRDNVSEKTAMPFPSLDLPNSHSTTIALLSMH